MAGDGLTPDGYLLWELDALPAILPQSKLGKGITYALNQETRLGVFLDDACVPMYNNDSERDLRHIIIGLKNWMTFANHRGNEVACRLYSLRLSYRQNNVNPEKYLANVLMRVATTPSSKIASLTPWAWGAAQASKKLAD